MHPFSDSFLGEDLLLSHCQLNANASGAFPLWLSQPESSGMVGSPSRLYMWLGFDFTLEN